MKFAITALVTLAAAGVTSAYGGIHPREAYLQGYEAGLQAREAYEHDDSLYARDYDDDLFARDFDEDFLSARGLGFSKLTNKDDKEDRKDRKKKIKDGEPIPKSNLRSDVSKHEGKCGWQAGIGGPRYGSTFRCIVPTGVCTSCVEGKHREGQRCEC